MRSRRAAARACLLALLLVGATARAQDSSPEGSKASTGLPPIPAFHGYVNDEAGVIGAERTAQLESFLDQVHQKTGAQFAVLTVQSCAPEDPSQFKSRVFNAWGIGDKERRDGVLLLVSMQEHALYFETGYGLEGTLPDGWQARTLRDLAVPEFRAGRPADGITAAVLAASQRIAAEKDVKLEWNGKELRYNEGDGERIQRIPSWVIMLVFFILFFVLFPALTARRRFRRGGGWYSPGGWGGGFGGWGGGFGGGGGGGSSFGGFGGGSSGGGGGGAHW